MHVEFIYLFIQQQGFLIWQHDLVCHLSETRWFQLGIISLIASRHKAVFTEPVFLLKVLFEFN